MRKIKMQIDEFGRGLDGRNARRAGRYGEDLKVGQVVDWAGLAVRVVEIGTRIHTRNNGGSNYVIVTGEEGTGYQKAVAASDLARALLSRLD